MKLPSLTSRQAVLGLRFGFAVLAWSQVGGHLHLGMAQSLPDAFIVIAFYMAATGLLLSWGRACSVATGVTLALVYHWFGAEDGVLGRHQVWLLSSSLLWLGVSPVAGWRVPARAPWPPRPTTDPGLHLVRVQLSVVYFFGALHKLTPAFLSGERLEAIAVEQWFGSDLPGPHGLYVAAALLTVVAELVLALGLWLPRLRAPLAGLGVALHVGFALLLPVQTFSVLAMLHYLAWCTPVARRTSASPSTTSPSGRLRLSRLGS